MEIEKLKLLNVGCGNKFHGDWTNIDMISSHPEVIQYNILNGLPFPSDYFNVVYHAQVLEHIPKEKSFDFLSECFRVLKPGGIIRIVLPDLENIVNEYKKNLELCLSGNDSLSEENYDWILLEMYDQTVRNSPGGLMAKYIEKPVLTNENYVLGRIGYVGKTIRKHYLQQKDELSVSNKKIYSWANLLNKITYKKIRRKILNAILTKDEQESIKIGQFRQNGEVHYWMYDRFSLSRLLTKVGFVKITVKSPYQSDIVDWEKYELDVKGDMIFDPTSLFIEGYK